MKNWIEHLKGLAKFEDNTGKRVAFETSAAMLDDLHEENKLIRQKLDLAIELFAQLYQVLGYHDASEKVMDAVSDAASGDFFTKLICCRILVLRMVSNDPNQLEKRMEHS